MKTRFWSSDWFAGLIITILVVVFSGSDSFQNLERSAYDWGVRSTSRAASDQIVIIAIDDASIANIGQWPWPRDLHAELITALTGAGAKVIGQTVLFLEPQINPGTLYIRDLIDFFSTASFNDVPADMDELSTLLGALNNGQADNEAIANTLEFYLQSDMSSRLSQDIETLKVKLFEAEQALNTDSKLAHSFSATKNVVLAMPLIPGIPGDKPDRKLPDYVLRNSVNQIRDRISAQDRGLFPVATVRAIPPIPELGPFASAIGHLNTILDLDGGIRSEALVLQYYDRFYPSMSLQIAAKSLDLDNNDMRMNLAESIELGSLEIKTDAQLMMNTFFYSDTHGIPAFQVDSFYDVVSGKIPLDKYKDKIVLIGATATGVASLQVTPISPGMAPVLTLAHSISSILNEDFFIEPEWSIWVRSAIFSGIALYLMLTMPRLKAGIAAVVSLVLLLAIIASHYWLMTSSTIWIPLMGPAVLLVLGHLLIITRRFLVSQGGKVKSDQGSLESNRLPGIANQGQLDSALWMKR